jgi:hypothetical protein
VEELVFAALIVGTLLLLDHQGILPRQTATKVLVAIYQVVEENVVAGILGFGILPCTPFVLLAFAGEAMKRQILEHRAILPFVIAYGLTTLVVVLTYFTSPPLFAGSSSPCYAVLTFLWIYSVTTLITALRTFIAFVHLVQNLHHLDKETNNGSLTSRGVSMTLNTNWYTHAVVYSNRTVTDSATGESLITLMAYDDAHNVTNEATG